MTIFDLPGIPILDDPENSNSGNGSSQDGSETPQPPPVTAQCGAYTSPRGGHGERMLADGKPHGEGD